MSGFHLVTDLDGTWIPEPDHLGGLRSLEQALRAHPGSMLTFATGRSFDSVMGLMASMELMAPDYLITDVGCALWHRTQAGGWVEDATYVAEVNRHWCEPAATRLLESELPNTVKNQVGVNPRRRLALEAAEGIPLPMAEHDLRLALGRCAMSVDLLPSHGRYLDLLPQGVDKGFAVSYLQAAEGLPRPMVCCGDSANDIGMLKQADIPILMGKGFIGLDAPGLPRDRMHVTKEGGPAGIHAVLQSLGLLTEVIRGH